MTGLDLPPDVQTRIRAEFRRPGFRFRITWKRAVGVGMLVGALGLGLWIGQRKHLGTIAAEDAILYALLGVTALLIGGFLLETRREPDVIRAFLAVRRCPACAYDLTGLGDAEIELVECPECGAAWRLPPLPSLPPSHPNATT